jgi:plastocyanin
MSRIRVSSALSLAALAAGACGGGGGTSPPPPPPPAATVIAKVSGDAQAAPLGTVLPNPLKVIVTQGGNPLSGTTVTWAITPAGGLANPASSATGADGTASTSITLPALGAAVTITASAGSATGSPIVFTADATGAGTTATVNVQNSFFSPDNFRIKQGGTVTFTWLAGAAGHTVTPVAPNTIPTSSNPPPPGTHDAPYTFDTTFPTLGTFKYFCSIHGAPDAGMHGTITVVP